MRVQALIDGQAAGFTLQHHRDAVADRVGQAGALADQFGLVLAELQRAFAHRAGQDVEQFRVHREILTNREGARGSPQSPAGSRRASRVSNQATKAADGTASTARYHQSSAAKSRHLSASFSVITSGSGGLKVSCSGVYRA